MIENLYLPCRELAESELVVADNLAKDYPIMIGVRDIETEIGYVELSIDLNQVDELIEKLLEISRKYDR